MNPTLSKYSFATGAAIRLFSTRGSYKDLLLFYKLEKKDFYTNGDNNLYKHLIDQNLFLFDNEEMYHRLKCCLLKNGNSSILTQCILIHYKTTKIVSLNKLTILLNDRKEDPSLKNTETILNYSKLLLQESSLENKAYIEDLKSKLVENTSTSNFEIAKHNMFAVTLYFGIMNNGLKLGYGLEELHIVVKKCLEYVSTIIDGDISNNYPLLKVFESFIIMCLNCITENFDHLWQKLDRIDVIPTLLKIIERSNMKKPVTLSADALRCLSLKMDEHGDSNFKVLLLDSTLESINSQPSLDLKIRRNPESRLVIHSLCCSEKNIHKPLLNWSMNNLLEIISDERSSDISVARTLHCIEILVADNGLHNHTLPYIPDIIVHCVELFRRTNWIIRNADLQLAKAIIDRFYGISLGYYNRPKCIEDLFILFPQLPSYFFKILCLESLDERAIMIFQFFSESQVKQKLPEYLTYFQIIFMDIIRKYPLFYGKCAARCLVALCCSKEIPSVVQDLINYLKRNFYKIDKNIFANMIFLLQELVAKIKNSEESENFQSVCHYIEGFQKFLGNFDTSLFDFLLVKTNSIYDISKNVPIKNCNNFYDRLWYHNNLPFLILNAKSSDLPNFIEPLLLANMPVCFKVKILSILIFRFEKNAFSKEDLVHLMSVICKSTLSSDENPYLLLCYFKVIILFRQNVDSFIPQLELVLESRNNLYKTLVALTYTSPSASNKAQFGFYNSALKIIIDSVGINEETDRDIMSSLIYVNSKTDSSIFIKICKLVFYYSLYYSTHQEAYNFISLCTKRKFGSILEALSVFLSNEVLQRYIKDKSEIDKLFHDLKEFVKIGYKYEMSDGYYSVDGDNLIPRQYLLKMLDIQNKNKKS